MRTREIEQEASIPTAARISLITLAEVAKYWDSTEYRVRTMSQLISWSIDLLRSILKENGKIDSDMTMAESNAYLNERSLYQAGVRSRAAKKVATGLRFESLREEGVDPKSYAPQQYNMLHNENSVQPAKIKVKKGNDRNFLSIPEYPDYYYPEGDEESKERLIKQLRDGGVKSRSEMTKEAIEIAREEGRLDEEPQGHKVRTKDSEPRVKWTDEEIEQRNREIEERDIERRKLENAPVDIEWLKKNAIGGK